MIFDVTFPESVQDGCLFESGGTGQGTFIGIVSNYFRITAGDGGDTNGASDSDTAVIMISLPDPRIPLDGNVHEVACIIKPSNGEILLFIDGAVVARAASTSAAFEGNSWTGTDAAGFGAASTSQLISVGGTTTAWPAGTTGDFDWLN